MRQTRRRARRAAARAAPARTGENRRGRDGDDRLVVARRRGDRVRARDGRPVVEAHLDPDRAPAALVRDEALAQRARHLRQRLRELARGRERRSRRCARATRRRPCAPALTSSVAVRSARGGAARGRGSGRSAPSAVSSGAARDARRASSARARRAARPSSGRCRGRATGGAEAKRAHACSRVSTTKPAGFSASEATFATSLFGPIPTEHVRPRRALDLVRAAGASRRAASAARSRSR